MNIKTTYRRFILQGILYSDFKLISDSLLHCAVKCTLEFDYIDEMNNN